MQKIDFLLNGVKTQATINDEDRLVDLLRENLRLTGTKEGCGVGECGVCTVLVDNEGVNSCLMLAAQADGKAIITVEGLANNNELHPLQKSFIDHMAVQCGYCTPAMLLATIALLHKNPQPSKEQIKTGISGVLCRCTGYTQIIEAIEEYVKQQKELTKELGL